METYRFTQTLITLARTALEMEERAYELSHQKTNRDYHLGRQAAYNRMFNEILEQLPTADAKRLLTEARRIEPISDQLRIGTAGKAMGVGG